VDRRAARCKFCGSTPSSTLVRLESGMTTSVDLVYAMRMKRMGMTRTYAGVLSPISLGLDGHRNQTRRRVSPLPTTIIVQDCCTFSSVSFELKIPSAWRISGDYQVLSMVSPIDPKTKFSIDQILPVCTAMDSYDGSGQYRRLRPAKGKRRWIHEHYGSSMA